MKHIDISRIRYEISDFVILDIFPENWARRKEFSLYKSKARPCSALFFVCEDIEAVFYQADGKKVCAKKGDAIFIPEGMEYYVRVKGNLSGTTDTYTVNLRLFDAEGNSVLLSENISALATRQDELFNHRMKDLCGIFYGSDDPTGSELKNLSRLKGNFFLLLDLLSESTSEEKEGYYPIRKGIEVFCREWNKNERIEKYAELCGVSVTYFHRCFKRWSGCSPIEYRNALRLSNAESLLRCTDMRVKEISEYVGFEDPFYFCRVFSAKYGYSPQNYRKGHQGNF